MCVYSIQWRSKMWQSGDEKNRRKNIFKRWVMANVNGGKRNIFLSLIQCSEWAQKIQLYNTVAKFGVSVVITVAVATISVVVTVGTDAVNATTVCCYYLLLCVFFLSWWGMFVSSPMSTELFVIACFSSTCCWITGWHLKLLATKMWYKGFWE